MKQIPSIYFSLAILIAWMLSSCAQIVVPGGGPVDKQAPRAIRYVPDSAALHFNSKNIMIEFDEYIQLIGLQKQLTVSPPMKIQPVIKVKGKQLFIELKDTLKDNTTYTLNFGKAICDFTEANPNDGFQYIFSTGSFIDTLTFSGKIENAFSGQSESGVLAMIYEDLEDSVPLKKVPSYFARSGNNGSFKISHIRPGTYKAFALKDENADYKYNLPKEQIAFSDTAIKVYDHVQRLFSIFTEDPPEQKLLTDFVRGYGHVYLSYALPVKHLQFKALNSATNTKRFINEFNLARDTVKVWFPDFGNDSLHFEVIADSTIRDSIKICTCLFDKAKQGRGEKFGFWGRSLTAAGTTLDVNRPLVLEFNHPLAIKDHQRLARSIHLKRDSLPIAAVVKPEGLRRLQIQPQSIDSLNPQWLWAEFSNYSLRIDSGSISDIFSFENDSMGVHFKTQEEKYYGTMKLKLSIPESENRFIFQMLNSKNQMVSEKFVKKDTLFEYEFLAPGKYHARLIEDIDNNDRWTTGSYREKRDPEKIIYYLKEINIRSNWDLELEWELD